MPSLEDLNGLSATDAEAVFLRCCGSRAWSRGMAWSRPFESEKELFDMADQIWGSLPRSDWLEAFAQHPRIGDVEGLKEKFAGPASGGAAAWAADEQKGAQEASEGVLNELARGNQDYERRYGHIFLVCATGKSAMEMLTILKSRMSNVAEVELRIAAGEQGKITKIRLEKWLQS